MTWFLQSSVLVASISMMSNGMLPFLQSSSTSCKKDCPTVFFNVSGRNPYRPTGSKGCICCSRIYSIRVKQSLFLSVRSIMSVLLWYFCRIYYYSQLPITRTLANSKPRTNSNHLDFRHTFTVILPLVTWTLDNSNSR